MTLQLKQKIELLQRLKTNFFERDFFLTWEHSIEELQALIGIADCLKELHKTGRSLRIFDSGLAISNFRDHSTRTRFSFASAADALGLAVIDLDETKSQVAHGETERETANMLSFLTEVVGIRDDMYLGEGDKYQRNFAQAVEEGFREGTLHRRPSVINLQSDIDHPTQSLADLMKLVSYFGGLDQLKGKKIAMTWAYSPSYGKPLSVPQGIIGLMSRFGMQVSFAYPKGYDVLSEVVELAARQARESGGSFEIVDSMEHAFRDADVVYPKSWAPFNVMKERTALLKVKDTNGLKELEKKCLENNAKFKDWECNNQLMNLTKNKQALYMHCLPADISKVSCVSGEVSNEVFERYRAHTYHEASFKPFVIAAMILLTRFKSPIQILEQLIDGDRKRFFPF